MSGEFTLEDKEGHIVFATSPGMEAIADIRLDSKKPKVTTKKSSHRPKIQLFIDLAKYEKDDNWAERFNKMSMYRFPAKISWIASLEKNIHGEIVYKNRQNIEKLILYKDAELEELIYMIKRFIRNYTNIDTVQTDTSEDIVQSIDKTNIVPIPWNKLGAKDHTQLLNAYVREYALSEKLSKLEAERLLNYLLIYSTGKNIFPYLEIDRQGNISHINGLQHSSDGIFKLKS